MYGNSIVHPNKITRVENDGIHEFEPSTMYVLEEFIKSGEEFFCINDKFSFLYNEKTYSINFVISKPKFKTVSEEEKNILYSNITMTDFKKIYSIPCKDLENIINCLNHNNVNFELKKIPKISLPVFDFICTFSNVFIQNMPYGTKNSDIVEFPFPIVLNAQTYKNLWYGNYKWYGDTSKFIIVKFIVHQSESS